MNPDDAADARPIWSFDCIGICSVLALSLDAKKLKQLCARHALLGEGAEFDATGAFYQLHKACHTPEGTIALSVSRSLDAKHSRTIRQVRELDAVDGPTLSRRLTEMAAEAPAGALWACLTDPRDPVNGFGVYESHRLVRRGLRREQESVPGKAANGNGAGHPLDRELSRARDKARSYAERNRSLQQLMDELGAEINRLKTTCSGLMERNQALERRPSMENQLRRTIRKLEYELNQARSAPPGEPTIETIRDLAGETEWLHPVDPSPCATCSLDGTQCDEPPGHCPLQALRVAVVGRLDRLRPQYQAVVEALGAEFMFHNGHCRAGSQILKNMVCASDLIVFITSINSHNALSVVKATCRKERKRFCIMRETSAHGLGRRLLEAVLPNAS